MSTTKIDKIEREEKGEKESSWHRLINNVNAHIEKIAQPQAPYRNSGSPPSEGINMSQSPLKADDQKWRAGGKKQTSYVELQETQQEPLPLPLNNTTIAVDVPSVDRPTSDSPAKTTTHAQNLSSSALVQNTRSKEETSAEKNVEFRAHFNLPHEVPISDFMCALVDRILYQGRMYITDNYICFHSSISQKSTKIIALSEMVDLQKKYTAIVFPNGIEVRTADKTYNFTSFLSRDETYAIIYNAWKSHFSKTPLLKERFEEMERQRAINDSEVEERNNDVETDLPGNQGSDYMSTAGRLSSSNVIDEYPADDSSKRKSSEANRKVSKTKRSQSNAPALMDSTKTNVLQNSGLSSSSNSEGGAVSRQTVVTPPPVENEIKPPVGNCTHSFKSDFTDQDFFVKSKINVATIDKFWKAFIKDDFALEVQHAQGLIDNVLSPWVLSSSGCCLERDLNFVTLLNNRLGPKSTRVTSSQRCYLKTPTNLCYECSVVSHDVPYGDSFHIRTLINATQSDDNGVIVQIGSILKWTKSVWGMKGLIEKFAQENNRNFANKMLILMDQKVTAGGVPTTPLLTKEPSAASLRPRSSSVAPAPVPVSSPRVTTVLTQPITPRSSIVADPSSNWLDQLSRSKLVGISCIVYTLTILPLWMYARSSSRRAHVSQKVAEGLADRLSFLENFLSTDPHRPGKFEELRQSWRVTSDVAGKFNKIESEIRRLSSQVNTMKEDTVPGLLYNSDSETDWLFWTVVVVLLSAATYFLVVKRRERNVITTEIHSKID